MSGSGKRERGGGAGMTERGNRGKRKGRKWERWRGKVGAPILSSVASTGTLYR